MCTDQRMGADYSYVDAVFDPYNSMRETDWKYKPIFVQLDTANLTMTYAVYLLIFIYVSIICLAAVGIIVYTRSNSIGDRNRQVFIDLEKLGAEHAYLRRVLKKQIQKMYVLPTIVSCILIVAYESLIRWQNDSIMDSGDVKIIMVAVMLSLVVALYQYIMYCFSLKSTEKMLGINKEDLSTARRSLSLRCRIVKSRATLRVLIKSLIFTFHRIVCGKVVFTTLYTRHMTRTLQMKPSALVQTAEPTQYRRTGEAAPIRPLVPLRILSVYGTAPCHISQVYRPPFPLRFRSARVDHISTIEAVNLDAQNTPISLLLDSTPESLSKMGMDYTLYESDGTSIIGILSGTLDLDTKIFTIESGNLADVLNAISEGIKLRADNSWPLALTSFYRNQVPERPGYYAWDHLRTSDKTPLYPQRPREVAPIISAGTAGGGTHTGMIHCKTIVSTNLLDADAYPWHGDWYRARVIESLGEDYDDNFRLWYNENADHIEYGARTHRLVQFDGIIQQAVRDVSAWVERRVVPAVTTSYDVVNSQVIVAGNAEERHGIQPVVDLTVNGVSRVDIELGQSVTFMAEILVPSGNGEIVGIEWDFLGTGDFEASSLNGFNGTVEEEFSYTDQGTYYPSLRVTSQREGNSDTPFARVQNLGRVRVVVH